MSIIKMLRHSNWIAVNKCLVKAMGCNAAYFLGYLADKYEYFASRGELTKDGYFYVTASDAEEELGLSAREQGTAIDRLVNSGLLLSIVKGVPAKRHFSFNQNTDNALAEVIMRKTSFDKSAKLELTKAQNLLAQNRETIYKEHTLISDNKIEINDKSFISNGGENQNAPQKEDIDYSEFDAEVEKRGFSHILNIKKRFTKEKFAAKRKEVGDDIFWIVLQRINIFIENTPPKQKYVDLPLVFANFLGTKETFLALFGLNQYWEKTYNSEFCSPITLSKLEKQALAAIGGRIAAEMRTKSGAEPSAQEFINGVALFFSCLPARWSNPAYFKLQNIANDFPQVLAAIKSPEAAQARTFKTAKEIDAENARIAAQQLNEKREKDYKAKFLQEDLERISKYVRNGMSVPDHLQNSEAYGIYISQQSQNFANDGW